MIEMMTARVELLQFGLFQAILPMYSLVIDQSGGKNVLDETQKISQVIKVSTRAFNRRNELNDSNKIE